MNKEDVDLTKLDNTVDSFEWCVKEFLEVEGYKVLDCGYSEIKGYTMPVVFVRTKNNGIGMITTELGNYLVDKHLREKGARHAPRDKMEF